MKEHNYTIANEVFDHFPSFLRGIVLACDVNNKPSPEELVKQLRDAECLVRDRLQTDSLIEDPRIKPWREAYRSIGIKPSEYRPSVEAMARRVLRNEPLPSINALVDIGNIVSLRYLVPAGSHAIDVLDEDMALRLATGEETFTAFGTEQIEHPIRGEIIFAEGNIVLTRRWTWRQSNRTITEIDTKAVEFNVDGLPPISPSNIEQACKEICKLVNEYCGGRTRYEILGKGHSSMILSI